MMVITHIFLLKLVFSGDVAPVELLRVLHVLNAYDCLFHVFVLFVHLLFRPKSVINY